jgi:DNA-binding GntR family transcriptional regulator
MQTHIFSKIEQRTVGREVVDLLREAIINGKLELGAHLAESELAEQMSVSRIPVREALLELEQEGLIIRQPNRGCFVIDFTDHDVIEVFTLRSMLESMAFEWAVPNLTETDFVELEKLIYAQDEAIRNNNYDELARLDMRFHEFICIKANHSRLLKAWYEQHAQCRVLLNLRFRTMATYAPETATRDHRELLAALINKDAQSAISLTNNISDRVASECIENLKLIKRTPS